MSSSRSDAVLTGASLGFDADSSLTYAASPYAVVAMGSSFGRYVTSVRSTNKMGFTGVERNEAVDGM